MKPLSGLDATFLYAETPTTPMNVIATLVVEGPVDYDAVVARLEQRLPQLPPFRRRLVELPLGLGHPLWMEDPDFDVRDHVTRVDAPEPGDARALEEVVGRLARRRLDRARPLWEIAVVEGLAEGRSALVVKAHHAAVDGVAGAAILLHLFDRPDEPAPEDPARHDVWQPEPEPAPRELFARGLGRLLEQPRVWGDVARRAARSASDIAWAHLADAPLGEVALPFQAPETSFNGPLSSRRSIAYARTPLESVALVRAAFGGTLNDVVLTACTRALQGELEERGEPADAPLLAAIPVSTRSADDPVDCGNRISAFLAPLPVQLADPVHQLAEIKRATRCAKRFHTALGSRTLASLAELLTPAAARQAFELYGRWKLAAAHRPMFNVTISNVPGPPVPLSLCGHPVRALHPHGPLMEGVGVNITVMSYAGSIDVGVLACADRAPQAHALAERVAAALEELAKIAEASLPEVPPLAREVA